MGIKIWLYGKPFSGKTKFATEFPKPFVINTDGNAQYFDTPYVLVKNINEFNEQLKIFAEGKHEYETLVIDVLEHIYDFTREYYLEKFGIDHESDEGYGKAWQAVKEGFWTLILKIASLEKYNIILISHETEYTEKSRTGAEITKFMPAINSKVHDRLCGLMQLVGRAYRDDVMLNGEPISQYLISFGSTTNELSGLRIPLNSRKIENNYSDFKKSIEVSKKKEEKVNG